MKTSAWGYEGLQLKRFYGCYNGVSHSGYKICKCKFDEYKQLESADLSNERFRKLGKKYLKKLLIRKPTVIQFWYSCVIYYAYNFRKKWIWNYAKILKLKKKTFKEHYKQF